MTIDLVCVYCGLSASAHQATLGRSCSPDGFILLDSHALDEIPPARRALERARLAQEQRGPGYLRSWLKHRYPSANSQAEPE